MTKHKRPKIDWIPVTKEMPPSFGFYLVCFDDGNVTCFDYDIIDTKKPFWGYTLEKVTHWYFLPEPPAEYTNEETLR